MTRVKRGNVARVRRKNILARTKGFRGAHSSLFRTANQQNMKALRYAYRDRRRRRRDLRQLWILRINSKSRSKGYTYSKWVGKLRRSTVSNLNTRSLAQIFVFAN